MRYTVLLHSNEEPPGYSASVPELPGYFSQGNNLQEALENAREAIELHIEGLVETGEDVPVEEAPFVVAHVEVRDSLFATQASRA